eukprot:10210-Chlamydomonas_euryale.AAC.2
MPQEPFAHTSVSTAQGPFALTSASMRSAGQRCMLEGVNHTAIESLCPRSRGLHKAWEHVSYV